MAFLDAWPDEPHLDLHASFSDRLAELNAVAMHLLGLRHAAGHFVQLRDIRAQVSILALAAD